ncbi:MAG TPA: cytochrome ubiquinol oxidase subunit I [Candidatus Acidoferrum sp.]|jgi:cytochrome d ubiquinol oxidase subunit I
MDAPASEEGATIPAREVNAFRLPRRLFKTRQENFDIPLLYYSYRIMVGLGTILIAIMALSAFFLLRGRLYSTPTVLWTLMLPLPFPYIATTAGWMTAELAVSRG